MKIIKNIYFLKVSGKMDCTIELILFFYIFQHRSTIFFDIFWNMWFFDIRIIKNCIIWMFWRLGTMPKRFFIAKSFRLHISKPKKIPGNIFFDISKVRKSAFWVDKIVSWAGKASRRGLLGGSNCILSQKSVPQGPFGRIKLLFEPESRPAGAFWAKYLISCESKVACKFLKKSPRVL